MARGEGRVLNPLATQSIANAREVHRKLQQNLRELFGEVQSLTEQNRILRDTLQFMENTVERMGSNKAEGSREE
jgi:hypothetical protein